MTEPKSTSVVLASASPRRLELLKRIGIDPLVIAADVDETVLPGESPSEYVLRVALDKAHRVVNSSAVRDAPTGAIIISADTSVVLDGEILGKPEDNSHARAMLRSLSGRPHEVLTSVVALDLGGIEHSFIARATVAFCELTEDEIEWYVSTGEPVGKAGAYAIQGIGEFMIESIEGAPSTVIGLPLRETIELLRLAGLDWP